MFTILTGIVLRLVKSLLRDPIRTTLQLIVHRAVSHSVLPFNTPHRYFSCQFKLGIYSSIAFFFISAVGWWVFNGWSPNGQPRKCYRSVYARPITNRPLHVYAHRLHSESFRSALFTGRLIWHQLQQGRPPNHFGNRCDLKKIFKYS